MRAKPDGANGSPRAPSDDACEPNAAHNNTDTIAGAAATSKRCSLVLVAERTVGGAAASGPQTAEDT